MTRTYSEMLTLSTLEDRFRYLSLDGVVGEMTFGSERFLNQQFYTSPIWRKTRTGIIVRDYGCDLGVQDREIRGRIIIHHINPLTREQVKEGDDCLFDPENLISVSQTTHNAIHYGDVKQLPREFVPRAPGDTKLW